jgi:hypothetical protein
MPEKLVNARRLRSPLYRLQTGLAWLQEGEFDMQYRLQGDYF